MGLEGLIAHSPISLAVQAGPSFNLQLCCRFTSAEKEMFEGSAGVMITTYTMIAYSGNRSEESQKVMHEIASREWGLMLLDEVHVVPANMFRKVNLIPNKRFVRTA